MRVRYIKHTLNGSNKNGSSHFVEIQAYGTNSTNIALNKKVTCDKPSSGSASGQPITCIVDGVYNNSNLYFDVQEANPTVTVDLGEVYDISMVKVWHYFADGRIYKNNTLSVSEDGVYYEEQFNSNIDGEYAETSSGKEIVIDKPYKPNVIFDVADGNMSINITPYGNAINSIDLYLRDKLVATFNYDGATITYPIDINTLAFGFNEYSLDVTYNTSEQINFKHVYNYDVVSVGSSTSVEEAVAYTSNMANTDERNRKMLAVELRKKDLDISYTEGIFSMIGKIKDIVVAQKVEYGEDYLFVSNAGENGVPVNFPAGEYKSIFKYKMFIEGSVRCSFSVYCNSNIPARVVVISSDGKIVFNSPIEYSSTNDMKIDNIKPGYDIAIQYARQNNNSIPGVNYSKLKIQGNLL